MTKWVPSPARSWSGLWLIIFRIPWIVLIAQQLLRKSAATTY